jgi:hypothetical protein
LQRCSVTGITSSSSVVSRTSSRLNGRVHWLLSAVHPWYRRLQMVPNAPSHHCRLCAVIIEP